MRKKKLIIAALSMTMLLSAAMGLAACGEGKDPDAPEGPGQLEPEKPDPGTPDPGTPDPGTPDTPDPSKAPTTLTVTNHKATIGAEGYYRFEAEEVDRANWNGATGYKDDAAIVSDSSASGGKYLGPSSGSVALNDPAASANRGKCASFTVQLEVAATVTLTAAYSQPNNKLDQTMDLNRMYGIYLDSGFTKEITLAGDKDGKTALSPVSKITWREFSYTETVLAAGEYTFYLKLKENDGYAPVTDYIDFTVVKYDGEIGVPPDVPDVPEKDNEVNGSTITVNKAGEVKFEAENADTSTYVKSGDNPTVLVDDASASGGKFLAAATGAVEANPNSKFTFTIDLKFPAQIQMSAAYAKPEGKKNNEIDMRTSYRYLITSNAYPVGLSKDYMLSEPNTDWKVVTYDTFTLAAGTHVIEVKVAENTGKGNPNIDYINFVFTKVDGADVDETNQVPANDFHTQLQYNYLKDNPQNYAKYATGAQELSKPNAIALDFSGVADAASYVVEYANNADFTNSVKATTTAKEYGVYNLMLGQKVYYRIASSEAGLASATVKSFTVAMDGPRNLNIEGVTNVRDIGGYSSSLVDGGVINQGLYFRGAKLEEITKAGLAELIRLGVKVEIDTRTALHAGGFNGVAGIEYHQIGIDENSNFADRVNTTRFAAEYKQIFELIANAKNAPVYLHCTAGADRTGIVSFFLLAVCGADKDALMRDFFFTNFSTHGERGMSDFDIYWGALSDMQGATTAEKAKAWMQKMGVEEATIEQIREIFVDGYEAQITPDVPDPEPEKPDEYTTVTVEGYTATIAEEGKYLIEAEDADTTHWKAAGGYQDKMSDANAHGGRYIGVMSGSVGDDKDWNFYAAINIDLKVDAEVTLIVAYSQDAGKNGDMDLSTRFGFYLDKQSAAARLAIQGNSMLTALTGNDKDWREFTYETVTLRAGAHTLYFKLDQNAPAPCLDYFKLNVVETEIPVEPETPHDPYTETIEAETFNLDKWTGATGYKDGNEVQTVDGVTFLGPMSGAAGNSGGWNFYATFEITLGYDAEVTLVMCYSQITGKPQEIDLSSAYGITVDGLQDGKAIAIGENHTLGAIDGAMNWREFTYEKVTLKAGTHTFYIRLQNNTSAPAMDYVKLIVE